jgi:hypothetical protein
MAQHFLIVHEEPDDGMDVEHPADCPTTTIYDGHVLIHTCEVGRHVEAAGLDVFFHRDTPHPHARGDSEQVSPGRWPIEVWSERTRYPGGWEYDGGLRLSGGAS